MLPDLVKASVATFDFKTETARALKTADEVWQSLQRTPGASATVAVVNASAGQDVQAVNYNSGPADAYGSGAQGAEVAAVNNAGAGRSRGRGGRRGRGGGWPRGPRGRGGRG